MDTVLLSLRWQNILAIWIIVILLGFAGVFGAQLWRKIGPNLGAS